MAERYANARSLVRAAILLCLAAAALFAVGLSAQAATQVPPGTMGADETWTASNSPYELSADVVVPRGVTLTLDAGTAVTAPGGVRLIVEGDLHAFGNPGSLVTFGPQQGNWGGLVVNAFGNATILNATVLAADRGILVSTTGSLYLADVTFRGIFGDAILVPQQTRSVYLQKVTVDGAARGLVAQNAQVNITAVRFTVKSTSFCVVTASASNIALLNFSLSGCLDAAVNMSLSSDITLFDGNISEWNGAAVSAISCARLNITSNQFYSSIPGTGIHFVGVSNSTVRGNNLATLALPPGALLPFNPTGVDIEAPTGANRIEQNTIRTFALGIRVKDAIFSQRIEANVVGPGSDTGIELLDSFNQTLLGNAINGRLYPFAVNVTASTTPLFFRHTIDAFNTANGSPIFYLLDQVAATFDLSANPGAIFALVNASNVTVLNANLSHGIPSLLIANSRDVAVRDSAIQSNITGIEVYNGTRTTLANITLDGGLSCVRFRGGADNRGSLLTTTRCLHGVLTEGQETRLVLDNVTFSNGTSRLAFFEGVDLTLRDSLILSPETTALSNAMTVVARGGQSIDLLGKPRGIALINVTIEGAKEAVVLEGFSNITFTQVRVAQSVTAVTLRRMSHVTFNGSSFAGELYGVLANNLTDSLFNLTTFAGATLEGVFCISCTNVTMAANTFAGNAVGLAFASGGRSLIVRNFFFSNILHATADSPVNDFDDGAIGNLWDDYTGLDGDDNGIGDTPYTIAAGIDQDRYPIARYPDDIGPLADAGPDVTVFEDAPLLLTGYLSTDDVGIRVYLWSFVDHGANVTVTGQSTRYVFRTPGTYVVTLTVIDWGANRATDSLVVTVLDRTEPHADAGGDRIVDEDVPMTLDGSASFDNDPNFPSGAAFTWWITDSNGTSVVFGRVASWTFATPGNFSVQLFVDDAAGYTDDTQFKVTVRDKTAPSVSPLAPPSAIEDFPFRVYGSNVTDNDPNWPAGMLAWFELRRGGELIFSTNASPGVFNVSDPGPYSISYYVRDASGNTGVASLNFDVGDVTPPDLSLFLERSAEVGDPFVMDLSLATDNNPTFPGGANATWTVQLAVGFLTLSGASVEHTFGAIGDWTVQLHLRDAGGNLAEKTFVVHVRDTRAPDASIEGPTTVEAGDEATFRAIGSDPSGISSYVWYVTGLAAPRSGATLVYRFYTPGSYQVSVKVEDLLGHITNVSATLYVVDTTAPQVVISTTPTLHSGVVSVGLVVPVQASFLGSDPSGIVSVEWAWGDGNVTNGTASTHLYAVAGNYTVLVRVADAAGNANTTTFRVEVVAPPGPPPDNGNNTQQPVPVSSGLPLPALIALIVAGTVGGVLVGLRIGRGPRRPEEPKP